MTFLLPKDYHSIIEFAIDLKEKDISHYFFSQYQQHKSNNTNFIDNLKCTLFELDDRFKVLISRDKAMRKDANEVKKEQGIKIKRNRIDWKNASFYYKEGILNYDFPYAWNGKNYKRFTINKFEEIKRGFEDFTKMTTEIKKTNPTQQSNLIKLNWKGQKNQIYQVLRELKEQEFIANSYNELADFLIQNVIPFQNTSKETIEKELKKKKALPKNKRVKISTLDKLK
jgi:hypothetical protein